MQKTDLIIQLTENSSLSAINVKDCVNTILTALSSAIIAGDGVEIRGFGSFYKKHRKARIGINPKTYERTQVRAKFVPFFKPSKLLIKALNT